MRPFRSDKLRRIGIFTGTRAEYGLLYPVIQALHNHPDFDVSLYVSGSHLDSRYGHTLDEIRNDGLPVALTLALENMGQNMANDCGSITQQMGDYLADPVNRPDAMMVLGDRYETLGVATAAFLSNIPLIHIHGGDIVRGGMLDDPIRHALTKLAHLHFPVTQASADRILAMGEEPWRVTVCGAPGIENMRRLEPLEKSFFAEHYGLDPEKPWILFTQHPITTQPEQAGEQARQTLSALAALGDTVEVIATYPNHDEGSQAIIDALKQAATTLPAFHVVPSLGRLHYLNLLKYVTLVIGNSSSGLLETAYFGVPCINVGERQKGRERGQNVLDVPQEEAKIQAALRRILEDESFRKSLSGAEHPFGDGHCSEIIVRQLEQIENSHLLRMKQLTY